MTRGAFVAHRVDQRGGLLGRLVGQAEDDDVDLGDQAQLRRAVLALLGRQAAQRDACDAGELVADLQAGRSGFAVDENGRCHDRLGRLVNAASRGSGPRGGMAVSVGGVEGRSCAVLATLARRRQGGATGT